MLETRPQFRARCSECPRVTGWRESEWEAALAAHEMGWRVLLAVDRGPRFTCPGCQRKVTSAEQEVAKNAAAIAAEEEQARAAEPAELGPVARLKAGLGRAPPDRCEPLAGAVGGAVRAPDERGPHA